MDHLSIPLILILIILIFLIITITITITITTIIIFVSICLSESGKTPGSWRFTCPLDALVVQVQGHHPSP